MAAVVTASHGAMGSLIAKLGDLLAAEYKLLKGAKGQILFLKAELESMHVFLKKISDTEQPDEQDKCWAKEVRELSYDIEDSVSEFMLRVESKSSSKPRGFMGFINRSTKLLTTMNIRHDIAKEFEGLKVHVVEVRERHKRYQQTNDVASRTTNTTIDLRLLAMYAKASSLVGMDGPRDELIQLMAGEDELKVLSIFGFGGLGKTTLANEIYRKLQGEFQCRAFVSVSQNPNIRKIMKTMLSQVGYVPSKDINIELWEDSEFISALQNFLQEQRYLIVIDDIWDASAWDIIRCALPENINGSRVLITTRIETVARGCCTKNIECVYKMKALSDQDSRSLFFKRIFGSEDGCPPNLKEVSAQILKKCGGMPLAIITTSSLIASQPSKQKEHWEYVRDCLGSNFEMSPSLGGMRQILNLSYIHLPHYLKTCMLYLGIYPEDYIIDKNDLTRRWIAEGFICQARGMDLEDIAKCYFNELINRSLIQPAHTNYYGEVMSCRVHDMMLDLILHKSREENFVTVIDDIRAMTGRQDKIRRLSLNLDGTVGKRVAGCVQLSQTRTLAIFGTSSYLPPFQLFKYLRVLGIEITVRSYPTLSLDFTEIRHLFQLRSLKIVAEGCKVVLPSKIGSMQQLETFEINATIKLSNGQSFRELPSDIVHLSQLLHLIIPDGTMLPNGIGDMKFLRTLHCFDLCNSTNSIKGLGELTNLTSLEIIFGYSRQMAIDEIMEKGREVLQTCLGKLCNLKCLYMNIHSPRFPYFDALSSTSASFHHLEIFCGPKFSRVPGWISQQHNLYELDLDVKQVFEEDVGILAQLPSLINLLLHIRGTPKDKIIIGLSGFPVLKRFTFGCSRMSCLAFVAGAMPKLERLQLNFNAKGWDRYGAAPTGTEHLSGLREIYIRIGVAAARESNRRAAESALRNAIEMHPGRPVANIKCEYGYYAFEDYFTFDDEREDVSDSST
ncbi:putative disease resistance RPP13-like protein 3 [Sorghum bicolor]|uniref:Uncharacterized protein n=1 Tax=Sorghum bicolor TaxID=4558 RepID=A0A1Z5R7G5_SORBI|nr:putative disease resistance RPP13-like protein 3 [Sorghum bicolor]XP_021302403.1 putative disease resistance RPP13-like protein 3 [Sorghum bicolor]OQU79713.1 hypothetical protein SORBI_3008G185200 [Sorghum bicolor]OQU79714.1 hypothetical protein SORBI_3008G185200 [Sorghum bicolor]|eukprot:XP_002442596.1 putative disease resistance RPP13-like protein 3 [Sorghum bicolor]